MKVKDDSFLLDSEELAWVLSKNTPARKLIAGIMLKFFQLEHRYPGKGCLPPPELVSSLIEQLNIPKIEIDSEYWESRNVERFCSEIRKLLGYQSSTQADVKSLVDFLIEKSRTELFTFEHYRAASYQFYHDQKIEPCSLKEMDRHIRSAMRRFEKQIFKSIQTCLSLEATALIDNLLTNVADDEVSPENSEGIKFYHLKQDLRGVKLKHIQLELEKLQCLRNINLPEEVLAGLHRNTLEKYYSRILAACPGNIREFIPESRSAMMAIFCYVRQQRITDYLTDFLIKLIDRIKTSAEKQINKQIVLEVKKVDGKFDILGLLAGVTADSPKGVIENEIYPKISQETLKDLANELKYRGKWYQNEVHVKMRSLYSHGQRAELLTLLAAFEFQHTHTLESRALTDALHFILEHQALQSFHYPETLKVPLEALPNDWKSLVYEKVEGNEKINRINYEIGILEALSKQLGYKGIWVKGAGRYRDPQEDLPQDWDTRREYYYQLLDLPLSADEYIKQLQHRLDQSLADLNKNILHNPKVKILDSGRIKLTPSEPQAPPVNLHLLQREISQRWSNLTMLDILKETDLLLG